jgi:hypothetical protein
MGSMGSIYLNITSAAGRQADDQHQASFYPAFFQTYDDFDSTKRSKHFYLIAQIFSLVSRMISFSNTNIIWYSTRKKKEKFIKRSHRILILNHEDYFRTPTLPLHLIDKRPARYREAPV